METETNKNTENEDENDSFRSRINQSEFWNIKSKLGRKAIFSKPKKMWEAACEYFVWCQQNTLGEEDYVGKDANYVVRNKMRPFTIEGLCRFLDVNKKYFNDFYDNVKDKSDEESILFSEVVTRIRDTIYDQKFTGAAVGFFNPNIIARDLGLTDKKETTLTTDNAAINDLLEKLSPTTLAAIERDIAQADKGGKV